MAKILRPITETPSNPDKSKACPPVSGTFNGSVLGTGTRSCRLAAAALARQIGESESNPVSAHRTVAGLLNTFEDTIVAFDGCS